MNYSDRTLDIKQHPSKVLEVESAYRWQVFYRLQALEIPCKCSTNQPLLVCSDSPQAAVQIWSVVRQFSTSRPELASWLDRCWQMPSHRKKPNH